MTISSLTYNNAMAGYLATSNSTTAAGSSSTSGGLSAAIKSASAQALDKAAHSFKSTTAQKQLEAKQTALTTDMRAAAAKAGLQLGGTVGFSLDSSGKLQVSGSDADKAAIAKLFKADKSQPSLSSRATAIVSAADALSTTLRQSAAISQASRYATGGANVMSMYGTLLQQQSATPATYSFSASASGLVYPGSLATAA